eukprot:gene3620-3964_t
MTSVVSPLGVTIKPIIVQFSSDSVSVGRAVDARPLFVLREAMNTSTPATDSRTVLLALTDLFHSIFFSHLHLNPKTCKVLLVEPMLACSQWRDCVLTVLLRDFKVWTVSFQSDLCLAALGSGWANGLIVSTERLESSAVAFTHDRVLLHTLSNASIGLSTLKDTMAKALQSTVEMGEEELWQILDEANGALQSGAGDSVVISPRRSLPRGCALTCTDLRLFLSSIAEELSDLVLHVIKLCPLDCRSLVAGNVLLLDKAGKLDELKDQVHALCEKEGVEVQFAQAADWVWMGAVVFSNSQSNNEHFLTLEQLCSSPLEPISSVDEISFGGSLLRTPDWMAVSPAQWHFFAPVPQRD